MPTTTKGFPYPANSDNVDVPGDMQALAEAIDTELSDYALTTALPVIPRGNKIINGAFDFWQRLASGSTTFVNPNFSDYTADRWRMVNYDNKPTSATHSQQAFTAGTAPVAGYEGQFFYRSTITTIGSCTQYDFGQFIEDARTFAGQTATVSFWAKADSSRNVNLFVGRNMGSGGSGGGTVSAAQTSFALTTSWQRFTTTITYSSLAGSTVGTGSSIYIMFRQAAASGSVLDLWGVQLEAGSVATPFSRAAGTLQGELAACQRYFVRLTTPGSYSSIASEGGAITTTLAQSTLRLPVTMRIAPTSVAVSNVAWWNYGNASYYAGGTFTLNKATPDYVQIRYAHGSAVFTGGQVGVFVDNNSTSSSIDLPAEL